MGSAIASVEFIRQIKTIYHCLDAFWSIDVQWRAAALHPGRQIHARQRGDMVRMEVREQHPGQSPHRQPGLCNALGRSRTDVDQEEVFWRQHGNAGLRAVRIIA